MVQRNAHQCEDVLTLQNPGSWIFGGVGRILAGLGVVGCCGREGFGTDIDVVGVLWVDNLVGGGWT